METQSELFVMAPDFFEENTLVLGSVDCRKHGKASLSVVIAFWCKSAEHNQENNVLIDVVNSNSR